MFSKTIYLTGPKRSKFHDILLKYVINLMAIMLILEQNIKYILAEIR